MTELLLAKPVLPVAGEYLHSRASELSSFMHRPQAGNWRRKLTASSGASGFAISGRRLPLFRRLVNSRKLRAIIRISPSVGAMRRSLCRPRRSRDCMRTTSSWPPRLTAYSLGRPRRERVVVVLQLALAIRCPHDLAHRPGWTADRARNRPKLIYSEAPRAYNVPISHEKGRRCVLRAWRERSHPTSKGRTVHDAAAAAEPQKFPE